MTPPGPTDRTVWIALGALTAVGALLRVWGFEQVGLTHFDEGVYALTGLWSVSPRGIEAFDPGIVFYAPAGFPVLVGLSFASLGVSDRAAIVPALLAGIATVPVVGRLAWRMFGRSAGLAASAFAAMAGPHVAFSRMAMTDAPFLLAWLVAMLAGLRAIERPTVGRSVMLGLAIGAAQWLKYSGWIAGLVVAVAALAGLIGGDREGRRLAARGLAATVGSLAVAVLLYLPWALFVERHGGYRSLMDHHASFVRGPSGWLADWQSQMDQAAALAGQVAGPWSWGLIAWPIAVVAISAMPVASGARPRPATVVALLALAIPVGLMPGAPWWIAMASLPALVREGGPAARLAAAWWLVMTVTTPLYHPYARLWLPVQAADWVIVGLVMARIAAAKSGEGPRRPELVAAVVGLVMAFAHSAIGGPWPRPLPGLLGPTDGSARVARAIGEVARRDPSRTEVRFLARPNLRFASMTTVDPVVSYADEWAVLWIPGYERSLIVVDEVQLGQEPGRSPAVVTGAVDPSRLEVVEAPLAIPTRLDIDPRAAIPGARSLAPESARVWILRPDGSAPIPSTSR